MIENQILDEIYKFREENALKFNYDISLIYKELKKLELSGTSKTLKLPLRKINLEKIL